MTLKLELLLKIGKALKAEGIKDYYGLPFVLANSDGVSSLTLVEEYAVQPGLSKVISVLWSIGKPIFTTEAVMLPDFSLPELPFSFNNNK